ncbi:MAG: Hpt domain-containing protein [Proteobacteria bacterium]|nr:Hpt domain-containing protein [Pseudomonadota bacterium]
MARLSLNQRVQWLPLAVTALCTTALALLLFSGVQLAARLQSASAALQLASALSSQPQLLRSELTLIQRGLETQTYVGDSLRSLANGRGSSNHAFARLAAAMREAGLAARSDTAALYSQAHANWQPLDSGLAGLEKYRSGDLYADSAGGSALTPAGTALKRTVDELLASQSRNTSALAGELGDLAALLRTAVVHDGQSLRSLLLGGAGLASLLLAMMLYFALRAGQSARAAGEAQRQIGNILGTVREGLFLIARDGRIGGAHSDSLVALLRAPAPAGQTFEELLRPLVDDKTLLAAGKFLGLLWKDKVNEELIESVNPLNQIEVTFHKTPGGSPEQRYLSFSFRRARASGASTDFVLGVVADVTDRVLLQRELEQLRANNDSNSALLLQLLQTEPLQLQSFLNNVEVGVRRSNALLRSPGIANTELQQKLQGVFREMHLLKGEAAALGMNSFVERTHAVEELLSTLRERPTLAGDDFVPVVVKLDELLGHKQLIGAMQERVEQARSSAVSANDIAPEHHGDTAVIATRKPPAVAPERPPSLEQSLQRLAREVSAPGGRQVRLACEGLDLVPAEYQPVVRDICIQMVRNAIVHGIEGREQRAAAGKPPTGAIRVRFAEASPQEYSLLVEDDGQGLDPARIRERALERGLLDAEQAAALNQSGAYRMLFQPGFSTASEVTEHAGRGVGLDVVNNTVRECGGRIGISTQPGKYTRFKMLLPRRDATAPSHSSAA